jgi:curved DNA-binding protein CbpA
VTHVNDFEHSGASGSGLLGRVETDLEHRLGQGAEGTYYAFLDVEPTATRVELREAYLRLKSTYGAGSAALYSLIDEDEAKAQLARAEEAYRVLSDEAARREYDLRLGLVVAVRTGGASFETGADAASERLFCMRERASETAAAIGKSSESLDPWAETAGTVSGSGSGLAGGTSGGGARGAGSLSAGSLGANAFGSESGGDPNVVRTTRSTLPVIKLRAQQVGADDTQAVFAELIATADAGDGDLYKRLREAAGVAEDEIVERTKVSIAYIRAIESNRFDRLPQAVYVKGFLRSYFRYLSVPDAERLVSAFSTRLTDWQTNKKS